jgi:hypothetical protein
MSDVDQNARVSVPRLSRGRPAKDREMTRKDGLRRVGKRAGQMAFPDVPARSGIGSERALTLVSRVRILPAPPIDADFTNAADQGSRHPTSRA